MMKLLKNAKRRLTSKRGVSMVEAIVAMAIIGTITLSALAVFANYNTVYDVNYDLFYARILADDSLAAFQYSENATEFKAALGMIADTGEGTGVDVDSIGDSEIVGSLEDDRAKLNIILTDKEGKIFVYDENDNEVDVPFDDEKGAETIAALEVDKENFIKEKNSLITYNAPRYATFTSKTLVDYRRTELISGVFRIEENHSITYHEPGLDMVCFQNAFWKEKDGVYVKMYLTVTGYGNGNYYDYIWITYDWKESTETIPVMPATIAYPSADDAKKAMEGLITVLTGGYNQFDPYLDDTEHPLYDHDVKVLLSEKNFRFRTLARIFESIDYSNTSDSFYFEYIGQNSNTIAGYIIEPNDGAAGGAKYMVNEEGEKILLIATYADDKSMMDALVEMNKGAKYSEKSIRKDGTATWNNYEFSKTDTKPVDDYTLASITMNGSNKITEIKDSAGNTHTLAEIIDRLGYTGMTDAEIAEKLGCSDKECVYTFTGTYRYKYTKHELDWHIRVISKWPFSETYYEYDKNKTVEDGQETVTFYVDVKNCKVWFTAQLITDTYSGTPDSGAKDKNGNTLKNRNGEVVRESTVGYYYLTGGIDFLGAANWDFERASSLNEVDTIEQNDILAGGLYKNHVLDIILNHSDNRIPTSSSKWPFLKGFSLVSVEYPIGITLQHKEVISNYYSVDYDSQTIRHQTNGNPVNASDTEMQSRISACVADGYSIVKKTFSYAIERVLDKVVIDDNTRTFSFRDRDGVEICAFSYNEEQEDEFAEDKATLKSTLASYGYTLSEGGYTPPSRTSIKLVGKSEEGTFQVDVVTDPQGQTLFTKSFGSEEEYLNAFSSLGFMTEEGEGEYVCQVNEYTLHIWINFATRHFTATIKNENGEDVYKLVYDKG